MYCPKCGHTVNSAGCSNGNCPTNNDYTEMGKVYSYAKATRKDRIRGMLSRIKSDLQELERLINEQ